MSKTFISLTERGRKKTEEAKIVLNKKYGKTYEKIEKLLEYDLSEDEVRQLALTYRGIRMVQVGIEEDLERRLEMENINILRMIEIARDLNLKDVYETLEPYRVFTIHL